MINSIDEYLTLLKKELEACDPATIQDALSDAEEHLRTALENEIESNGDIPESKALSRILTKYGAPSEIAAAYQEIETRIKPALARQAHPDKKSTLARFLSIISEPGAWGALLYLLFSLIAGLIYFTWAVIGLSLSLSLSILIIGIPFLLFFLVSIRTISLVEGRIIEALLGVRMPRRSIFIRTEDSWWKQVKFLVFENRTWSILAYMLFQFPLGLLYFVIFTIMIALSLSLILTPIAELGFQFPMVTINDTAYHTPIWLMPFVVIAGFAIFLATMHLAKIIGRVHATLAKSLLLDV